MNVTSPAAEQKAREERYLEAAGWEHESTFEEDGVDTWRLPPASRKDLPDFVSRTQHYWDRDEAVELQRKIEKYVPARKPDLISPWIPMNKAIDLKHLNKLLEELGEATAASARCLAQGINEHEPITGKCNKEWLEEELADVAANIRLVVQHFGLDAERMIARQNKKMAALAQWHGMLAE